MKIKARLLMPSLAALTVLAIMGTGIVLGQLRGGVPWVTLLGSAAEFAAAAEADAIVVADSGLFEDGASQLERPNVEPASSIQPVLAEPNQGPAGRGPGDSGAISDPSVPGGSPEPGSSQPSSPEPNVTDGEPVPGVPADGSIHETDDPREGTGADGLQPAATPPPLYYPALGEPAVQLAAVVSKEEPGSAEDEVKED